ncbi:hypothetical protein PIB30_086505 [Stylosanthes scabra]|uniref:Uncharacterized protein n=1 Tax=Stylosanthes scabra TaxID=79078 RepID=A0ABU6ZRT9_9FABA|nr:hypothetical protein [Stylosanthes scabra]
MRKGDHTTTSTETATETNNQTHGKEGKEETAKSQEKEEAEQQPEGKTNTGRDTRRKWKKMAREPTTKTNSQNVKLQGNMKRKIETTISMEAEESVLPNKKQQLEMEKISGKGCRTTLPTSMKLISWNCRGLGNPWAVRALNKLLQQNLSTLSSSWKQGEKQ